MDTMQFSKPTGALTRSISTRSFASQPVAPLNITSRPPLLPLIFGPRKTDSPLFLHPLSAFVSSPSSPFSYQPLTPSSQANLEANVRHLCDLVDSAFTDVMNEVDHVSEHGQEWRSSVGTLCIQIPNVADSDPDTVLSPRTLDQAKFDISKVDQEIVLTMNSNLLLSLFPSPPNTRPSPSSLSSIATASSSSPSFVQSIHPLDPLPATPTVSVESTTSVVTSTSSTTTEGLLAPVEAAEAIVPTETRKQEQSAKRNWAIPPGLVLFQSHLSKDSNDSPPSPCSSQRSSSLPGHRGCPSLPSPTCSSVESALSSPISPHALSPMEGLSQRLLAIETQMRRPSFLVNRRTSILSTLFASNAISPLMISEGNSNCTGSADGNNWGPLTPQSPLSAARAELESFAKTSLPVLPLRWNLECLDSSEDLPSPSSPSSENPFHFALQEAKELDARGPTTSDPCSPSATAEGDVDWRAWHANWNRRRPCKASKLQKQHQQFLRRQQDAADSLLSPLSPISPGAFSLSSEISTLCSPTFTSISSGNSTLCSRVGSFEATSTRKIWPSPSVATVVGGLNSGHQSHSSHKNSNNSIHQSSSPLKKFQSSPAHFTPESSRHHGQGHQSGKSKHSIKDANPELWEDVDGQKWKDRFQSLVHNFQTSAGKHSRRLAEILPKAKSRWVNKKSSPSQALPQISSSHSHATPSSAKVW